MTIGKGISDRITGVIDYVQRALKERKFEALAKRISNDPPDDLAEYAALAAEIEALVRDLVGQRQSPEFDSSAMKAARAKALAGYLVSDADLDTLPPVTPTPTPPSAVPYGVELNWHPLGEEFAKLLAPTDKIYRRKDGSTGWIVTRVTDPAPNADLFELDPSQPSQP